jgi:hypothetical protein
LIDDLAFAFLGGRPDAEPTFKGLPASAVTVTSRKRIAQREKTEITKSFCITTLNFKVEVSSLFISWPQQYFLRKLWGWV